MLEQRRLLATVSAAFTADNHYGLYVGNEDGSQLTLIGRNESGPKGSQGAYNWSYPETFQFDAPAGSHLFLVAWDSGLWQMAAGEFTVDGGQTIGTNAKAWEVMTSIHANPGETGPLPDIGTLAAEIQVGAFQAPQAVAPPGTSPWGRIPGLSDAAQFIWPDTFAHTSASDEHYVIFRTTQPIDAPHDPPATAGATLTADNHYGLFVGSGDGQRLSFIGRNETGLAGNPGKYNWSLPETWSFTPQADDHIYVVAWDAGGPQSWIGQFTLPDGSTLVSNSQDWEYVIGAGPNPGTLGAVPPAQELRTRIAAAGWQAIGAQAANGASPWGTIPGISPTASFIWHDQFADGSASDNGYAIYRTKKPVTSVAWVDLDVDSDNTGMVDRSAYEESIESALDRPGVIVPVGGPRAMMVAELSAGSTGRLELIEGADKVTLWDEAFGGSMVFTDGALAIDLIADRHQPSTTWTFWIEASAASETLADIAFTLTLAGATSEPSGSSPPQTVRATAGMVDLVVDELPAELEDVGAGAIVWRNSDFSRAIPYPDPAKRDAEPGLPRYVPDYSDTSAIDPEYATQFTPGRATFTPGLADAFGFQFVFDASKVALWTRENWIGFDEVTSGLDGWWRIPTGTTVNPGPGGNRERIDFWIEGLASTGYGKGRLELFALPNQGTIRPPAPFPDTVTFTVVDVGLGVDGNRDGTIDFSDSHDRRLTFWLNDDGEVSSPYEREDATFTTKDSDDDRITTMRDLEDFASLHFLADPNLAVMIHAPDGGAPPEGTRPTYRYTLSLGSADTQLRLFDNAPQAEALAHVRDIAAAHGLLNTQAAEVEIGSDATVLRSLAPSDADDRFRYLFEAFGNGGNATLELAVTVTYPQSAGASGHPRTTSRSHTIDLDLRPVAELFSRMQVPYRLDGGIDSRYAAFSPGDSTPHFGDALARTDGTTSGIPFLSGHETVVLVHGWNMTDGTQTQGPAGDWKRAFAETAFKRLYWQGFRGNFVSFEWPTFSDSEGPAQGGQFIEAFNASYNASEFQAFRSGQALKNLLAGLGQGGPVHLLAHSMGNVVAAEAMRQWVTNPGSGELATSYVAMQGALSAGAYGDAAVDAIPAPGSTTDLYLNWPTGVEGAGSTFYMDGTQGAAAKWINMFNPVDKATSGQLTGWPKNNSMKPLAGSIWRDILSAPTEITARRFAYFIDSEGRFWRSHANEVSGLPIAEGVVELTPGLVGPDSQPGPSAYEIIAFMAKANAMPIGTKVVDFFGTNIDINDFGLPLVNANQWSGHSFQFHFDAATTSQFWKSVVNETDMDTVMKPRAS